ncbi:cytochrome P450 [Streptomyces sp. NPDC090052]|uniref:cytochrome P450 n=1 Tax=unclassified Streptomyces TaxID=2593676 RepID=UPI00225774EF|nr:cytochrome P450 [Streptomyces sp. NBC_01306]MCX4723092.1 cytochrome P450 [Streptomyces sp. NBC_01306]WSX45389.1 cytochrome P450 [Streptomyces sp. NBC_00963]
MQYRSEDQGPPPGCPAHNSGKSVPLYGPEFAADPDAYYEHMRAYGTAAPVELSPGVEAHLVTDYAAALHVLQNPDVFARDSRRWRALSEGQVPLDSPILPMMAYRPNCLFTDGTEHLRLRQAVTSSLARIDTHRVSRHVDRVATYLIEQFSGRGRADLIAEYAQLVPLLVFNDLFGCPAEIGDRLVYGISCLFDGVDVEKASEILTESLFELVTLKRSQPGEDITSWLMQHEARLSDEEMIHQLVMLIGAGTEPTQNIIANALRLLLSDDKYSGGQHSAGLLVEDAINDVLWNGPPIANYAAHYPLYDVDLSGTTLRAGDPVVISFAAANSDPALSMSRQTLSKRAHLAWGAGVHACPAKDPALLISVLAIEKLLNTLPDIDLAVPADTLTWRPGPFHRALAALPARFTPEHREKRTSRPYATGPRIPENTPAPQGRGKPGKGSWWSGFLTWWKV